PGNAIVQASGPGRRGEVRLAGLLRRAVRERLLVVPPDPPVDVLRAVPALAAAVPGYAAHLGDALAAPSTPAEIVDELNREIDGVHAYIAVRTRLSSLCRAGIKAA